MTTLPSASAPPTVQTWTWRTYPIAYVQEGSQGPAIVLVHGFGASWGHWRKLMPLLADHYQVYALDLLGFGASAKPTPGEAIAYTFETWGALVGDFCREVVQAPVTVVGNSIGCVVAMQTAVDYPDWVQGVALINCSLRLLHDRYRSTLPWFRRTGAGMMQSMLGVQWLGRQFFQAIAKPKTVRRILLQAYAQPSAVTDDLVSMLMTPAADAGAADVFLAFTRYSQGPLPEDLLAILPCPALILWGVEDPWEPIDLGRRLAEFDCVDAFIPLEQAGHCPQDEVPEVIAPLLQDWMNQKGAIAPSV